MKLLLPLEPMGFAATGAPMRPRPLREPMRLLFLLERP
jgi:hypothetical protein